MTAAANFPDPVPMVRSIRRLVEAIGTPPIDLYADLKFVPAPPTLAPVGMVKMEAGDLIGDPLDWAIMAALGEPIASEEGLTDDERYSTDWAQGGPLLQRLMQEEHLKVEIHAGVAGAKREFIAYYPNPKFTARGDTMLIAGFRTFVAGKLGRTIDVPAQYLPKPLRKIRVEVNEQVTEVRTLELEVPHDLNLEDTEALDKYLEEEFVQGRYQKIGDASVSVNERDFGAPELV